MKKKEKNKISKNIFSIIKKTSNISKIRENMSELLEIPIDVAKNSTKVTCFDTNKVLIEGYKNVEDYQNHYIKVCTMESYVVIDGKNLDIKEITKEDLIVSGEIYSLNFKR